MIESYLGLLLLRDAGLLAVQVACDGVRSNDPDAVDDVEVRHRHGTWPAEVQNGQHCISDFPFLLNGNSREMAATAEGIQGNFHT